MTEIESKSEKLVPSDGIIPPPLSNIQRLRTHLASGSLAATLLTAWEEGDAAQTQARMLKVVNNFHMAKQVGDDENPA